MFRTGEVLPVVTGVLVTPGFWPAGFSKAWVYRLVLSWAGLGWASRCLHLSFKTNINNKS